MKRRSHRHRGATLIYVSAMMTVLAGFASFAADYGHVQVAKLQLESAADAAARYGASGLTNIIGTSAAASNAVAAAAANTVDGHSLVLDPVNDVQIGVWNSSTKTFTVNSNPAACNAVRVVAHLSASRGTAVNLVFGQVIGRSTCDVSAQSIALVIPGTQSTFTANATGNPFLAGMPAGSSASNNNPHNSPDYAGTTSNPRQSPLQVQGLPITPGTALTFDGISGGANNDFSDPTRYSADGNTGQIVNNTNGAENGISDIVCPINGLIGVFLGSSQPNQTSAPSRLDFSSSTSRDFTSLQPQLKQLFFIGDGRNSNGEVQHFVVPAGATRLFVATMDAYEWNNNVGSFSVTAHQVNTIKTVK